MPDRADDDIPPADPGRLGQLPDPVEDDEGVGYRRPPKRTRFRKGRSGNPAGRPKGRLNRATVRAMVEALWLEDQIKILEGGRERHVPRLLALMKKQGEIALKGDRRAIKDCLDLVFRTALDAPEPRTDEETAAEDEAILRIHHPATLREPEIEAGIQFPAEEDDRE